MKPSLCLISLDHTQDEELKYYLIQSKYTTIGYLWAEDYPKTVSVCCLEDDVSPSFLSIDLLMQILMKDILYKTISRLLLAYIIIRDPMPREKQRDRIRYMPYNFVVLNDQVVLNGTATHGS